MLLVQSSPPDARGRTAKFSCSIIPISIVILISIYLIYSLIITLERERVGLIILKLPRSGSSFFTEKMNNLPFVYLTKEIIQGKHRPFLETLDANTKLRSALTIPSDKIATRSSLMWWPSGRFLTDYIYSGKFAHSIRYVGFTLNPEHLKGFVSWENVIVLPKKKVKLIIYRRSNVIKAAISGYSGKLLHSSCGTSNIRTPKTSLPPPFRLRNNSTILHGETKRNQLDTFVVTQPCLSVDKINWTVADFAREVNQWQRRRVAFDDYISSDSALKRSESANLYYESLQLDIVGEFKSLFTALSKELPRDQQVELLDIIAANAKPLRGSKAGAWKKRAHSEDLRLILSNFDDIVASMLHPSCRCLHAQLTTASVKVFDSCRSVINVSSGRCYTI